MGLSGSGHGIHPQKRHGIIHLARNAAIIVIIVAVIAYLATSSRGTMAINSNTTVTIRGGQSLYFKLDGAAAVYSLFAQSTSNSYAVFYMSRLAVLTNPIAVFSLAQGEAVNASAAGSPNADIRIKLLAATAKNATIELLPIPSLFSIPASPSIQIREPASFYNASASQQNTVPQQPAANSITTPPARNSSKTSNATTPTAPATAPTASPMQNISTILNTTYIARLMNEYDLLYIKDRACTPSAYNATFLAYRNQIPGASGQNPVGPFDFANASAATPTNLSVAAAYLGNKNYSITYSLSTPRSSLSGPALTMRLSSASGIMTDIAFKGLFYGSNYTQIENAYTFQEGIAGNCGAYIS